MKQELQDKLKAQYPELLRNLDGDVTAAPLSMWGIECPNGWYHLLDMLCRTVSREVARINKEHPELELKVAAEQIKEKFGTLRFYYSQDLRSDHEFQELAPDLKAKVDRSTLLIRGAVSFAEDLSEKVCVGCGILTDNRSSAGFPYAQCVRCTTLRARKSGYALDRLVDLDEELGLYRPPADDSNNME